MNILQINASLRAGNGHSTRVSDTIVARLQARHPSARVTRRDLVQDPHPMLDDAAFAALTTPAEQRSAMQAARVALDDAAIAQVQAADAIVLGVPMYNYGIPAQLKHWIDAIARAGVTFRYTANGPEGLLTGKKAYIFATRGGLYAGTPLDSQTTYVRDFLGFLGITDVEFIYAEGLNMGEESKQAALAKAQDQLEELAA